VILLDRATALGLHLNADLVVLSACKSGLGKELAGEGLLRISEVASVPLLSRYTRSSDQLSASAHLLIGRVTRA
jgi:hypothetical protein